MKEKYLVMIVLQILSELMMAWVASNSPNCDYLNEKGECEECFTGYAVTYDGKSCKQFEGCKKLAEGNEKCSECDNDENHKYFRLNSEGKCERTQCENYDNDVCTGCFEGYYLDDKKNC